MSHLFIQDNMHTGNAMIKRLHRNLSLFLSLFLAVILILMSNLFVHAASKEYENSMFASFTQDTSLLYTYLAQNKYLDAAALNEYADKNLYVEISYIGDILLSTTSFPNAKEIAAQSSPYKQPDYWHDYYDVINQGSAVKRQYQTTYAHKSYWNSYSIQSIGTTIYTVHAVYNNQIVTNYNHRLILISSVIVLAAIFLLSVFSWFFVRKILRPVEEAYTKQDEFIAIASHELKTPLTIIKSCLSGLNPHKESGTDVQTGEYLTVANKECLRMTNIINNLLTFANIRQADTSGFEPVDPTDVLIECYNRFEAFALSKQLDFLVQLPEEPVGTVTMDKDRIIQCLSILIDNAISYTEEGSITLSLSNAIIRRSSHICLQVADTGIGIPDDQKKHIFDKFYSTRRTKPGESGTHVGLGLNIAADIAQLHHATLTVCDNKPHGSVFTLMF